MVGVHLIFVTDAFFSLWANLDRISLRGEDDAKQDTHEGGLTRVE